MSLLSIISALFSIGEALAKMAHDRQFLKRGEYKAIAENTKEVLNNVKRAKDAINRANADVSLADRLRKRYRIKSDDK